MMIGFASSFIYLCAIFAVGLLIVLLQLWLSSRKSSLPGLSIIAVVSVLFLSLTFWAFHEEGQYREETLTCSMAGGRTAEATILFDKDDEILSVTNIFIRDGDRTCLEEVGWGDYHLRDVQEKLKGGYDITENTRIKYESDLKHGVIRGNMTFNRNLFLIALIEIGLPLLCIHLFIRYRMKRKKQSEEMERMNIQDL